MRYYYGDSVQNFLQENDTTIFGHLSKSHSHDLEQLQKNAWLEQISILKTVLKTFTTGHIFFEFSIPRMGKRVDNIIILHGIVFVIEFKVGEREYPKHAIDQVVDYSLDLKNFHEGSHHLKLVPVLVASEAPAEEYKIETDIDGVFKPLQCNRANLPSMLEAVVATYSDGWIDAVKWAESGYKPTPTIVEAAQALYKGHSVTEISRSDSGAKNLRETSNAIIDIIEDSKTSRRKSICFITGVPGSGKTLAGLHIANTTQNFEEEKHAVFLSGNGPLVDVLREALARDEVNRTGISKKDAQRKANTFIKNVHHFRDEGLETELAPHEKIVIFDEAQRAWNMQKASYFMKTAKGNHSFDLSEPEFLISVMDRHKDWAVIVCLIGGGQEINDGEAGLLEWFSALAKKFTEWDIYISPNLTDSEYMDVEKFYQTISPSRLQFRQSLHLGISVRSFRSEHLARFVKLLLDLQVNQAKETFQKLQDKYPVFLTRDINSAKKWLKERRRGTERIGIVASSRAQRLKPYAINIKDKVDAPNYFLNDDNDVRSSYFLEDVATEFDIQGLELDWVCVAWDANLVPISGEWLFREFRGSKWGMVNNEQNRAFLKNAYRVLLTRARQGMIIFVPTGDQDDHTRPPEFYDRIFNYLREIGIPEYSVLEYID